jgi:hypothetical protein
MAKDFVLRKRYILGGLAFLSVIAIVSGILLVRSWLHAMQDPQFISATLSRALECPATVEKVSISLLGRLILKNVIIYTPDALERRREMLTAPIIMATFSPWKILTGKAEESLTSVELRDPTLRLAPDTLQWFQKKPRKGKGALPSISIKSGTLELSGFPMVSLRQFRKIQGTVKLHDPRWEFDLKGTSSDLQEKWEFQGKGPAAGKPLMKLRGQNVEVADIADEGALKGLPHCAGRMDFQAEFLEPEGWKGKVEAGKLSLEGMELSKCAALFAQKGDQVTLSGLSFNACRGIVNGEGTLSLSQRAPQVHIRGTMKNLRIEEAGALLKDMPLKGSLSGTMEISREGKSSVARGDFDMTDAALSTTLKEMKIRGHYELEGETLGLKGTRAESEYGVIGVDGKIGRESLDLRLSSRNLDLSRAFKDSSLVALPKTGSVEGTIKGTSSDRHVEGTMAFPVITLNDREIKGFSLKGSMHIKKGTSILDGLVMTLGNEECHLKGTVSKGREGKALIALKELPLSLLNVLVPGNPAKTLSLENDSLSLDLELLKKAFSGSLSAGKGTLREFPFESLKADFSSKEGKIIAVQGTLAAGDPISFSGKISGEGSSFDARTKRFAIKDLALMEPHLVVAPEKHLMKGTLTASRIMAGKETLTALNLAFHELSPERCVLSGSMSWASNAVGIAGTMEKEDLDLKLIARDFSLESLGKTPGKWPPMTGKALLELSLLRKGGKDSYALALSSKNLTINKKKFPSLTAALIPDKDVVRIKSLVLKNEDSLLSLSGMFTMAKSVVDLKGDVKDQAIEDLLSLVESGSAPARGRLTGALRLQGPLDRPSFTFSGSGTRLGVRDLALGSGKLSCTLEGKNISGSFTPEAPGTLIASLFPAEKKGSLMDALKGEWKKMSIAFSQKGDAPLELNGEGLHTILGKIVFKGKMDKGSWEMTFWPRQLTFATLTFTEPELRLMKNGDIMSGSIVAKTGKMEEFLLLSPHFAFEDHDGLTFTGNCTVLDSEATISGKSSGDSMQYTIKIPSFNLKNLSAFKIKEDNLSGIGNFEATMTQGSEKSLRFSIQSENLYWAKKKLPRLSLDAEQKKSILLITALRIFTGTKPIFIAGNIIPEKQTCALNGKIEDASLPALMDLAGGKAPDLQGGLNGALAIQGDLKKPEFHFEGRVLQLIYKGKNMGDGSLKVGGTSQAISGRLDLDRPPKYRAGLAPANMEISYYFSIEGTAKDPVIKPQASGTKFNVNPGAIWQLFQMPH